MSRHFRPFTKAERKAYGEMMRAKRQREDSRGDSREGKPIRKSHLYSGKARPK